MNKVWKIIAGIILVALLFAGGFGWRFFSVGVDRERASALITEYREGYPVVFPEEQNRLVGYFRLAQNRESYKGAAALAKEFVQLSMRPYGVVPYDFENVESVGRCTNAFFPLIKLNEDVLNYADFLTVQRKWEEVWPLIESSLKLSGDLTAPPASMLQMMAGQKMRYAVLEWLAHHFQNVPFTAVEAVAFRRIQRILKESGEHKALFKDLFITELAFIRAGTRQLLENKELQRAALSGLEKMATIVPEKRLGYLQKKIIARFPMYFYKREQDIRMKEVLEIIDLFSQGLSVQELGEALDRLQKRERPLWSVSVNPFKTLKKRYGFYYQDKVVIDLGDILMGLGRYYYDFKHYPVTLQDLKKSGYFRGEIDDDFQYTMDGRRFRLAWRDVVFAR